MITFLLSIVALVVGFLLYGRFVERIFRPDPARETPAIRIHDGVDYVPMPGWKIFMIQFLNIAGLGPIFGAILGAMYGPAAFIWIVLGSILAGGVHDFFSGMLSERNDGASISEVVGIYLGPWFKQFMRVFSVVLLVLVGVVFVLGPAKILKGLTGVNVPVWIYLIFAYYLLATLLPIDKIIGRIYPLFGGALLFMALAIGGVMIFKNVAIPNVTVATLHNMHSDPGKFVLWPMLFITIACGAISGFHATQSPLMARCITSEKQGRNIFYGAMIAEGIVALIWAAAAMSFFGGVSELNATMAEHGNNAAWFVNQVCDSWLGKLGGALAILGVVACPITSGDTAFRSARLTIADVLKLKQKAVKNRLYITLPLFAVGLLISSLKFDVVWRYFAWSNQTLATVVLWTAAMYLIRRGKLHWIATLPATFMTAVCSTYILVAPEGFSLSTKLAYPVGLVCAVLAFTAFMWVGLRSTDKTGLSD